MAQGTEQMCKDLFPSDKSDAKALGKLNKQFANCRFGDSYEEMNEVVRRIRAYGDETVDCT